MGDDLLARYGEAIMGTYGAPALALERGEGSYVWDADGTRYLDLLGRHRRQRRGLRASRMDRRRVRPRRRRSRTCRTSS